MLRDIDESFISSGIKTAQNNTWGNKYRNIIPNIQKEGAVIKLSYGNILVEINSFDEIILTIIMKFLFMPIWLIKQCYNGFNIIQDDSIDNKINSWIDIGLVWKESAVTGNYIRPTYSLFTLFGESPYTYTNIPFNTLTHTICEEKVMFDVMSGESNINSNEKDSLLPRVSELGFKEDIVFNDFSLGTNIIAEEDFRNPKLYTEEGIKELNDTEYQINKGIKEKATITPELTDFRQFVLIKKIDNTGFVKKDYKFHVPDLIIPCLRKEGRPKSIAIEVELSNKRARNYEETMLRYKDNNKYGTVYWLCNTPAIMESLRSAYTSVGGTGTCKTKLIEFIIPTPDNF